MRGNMRLPRNILVSLLVFAAAGLLACYGDPAPTEKPSEVKAPAQIDAAAEKLYTIKGTVFHDYNGDGVRQDNEPGVPDVLLDFGHREIRTNAIGQYEIELPDGNYVAYMRWIPRGSNGQPFRYISASKSEIKSVESTWSVIVGSSTVKDIGLMQGFMTLPFGSGTKFLGKNKFGLEMYVDRSNKKGTAVDWRGGGRTYDGLNGEGHDATDFFMEGNTPILAAAPGVVIENPYPFDVKSLYGVILLHEDPSRGFSKKLTLYWHLNKALVNPGTKVERGDVIGLSGRTADDWLGYYGGWHLHFTVANALALAPLKWSYTDPYRSIVSSEWYSPGYWTKDNDPQYPH
jgi:murein DD-endopeptidase MepM/ murein hydrolase activator NlpD